MTDMATQQIIVLVVDDTPDTRATISLNLGLHDFFVQEAENGTQAITILQEGEKLPDVILLDQMMPGMDGLQTFQKIKDICPNTPVIMITAHGSLELAVEFMKQGGAEFLQKPLDYDVLDIKIKRTLETKKIEQERDEALIAQHAAEDANQLKNIFVENMMHEGKTPLHLIASGVKFMQKYMTSLVVDEKAQEYFDLIIRGVNRLERLQVSIMSLSQFEHGKIELERTEQNILSLVQTAANEVQAAKSMSVTIDIRLPTLTTLCDGDQLMQVFTNLISNAVRYSPEGGTITIDGHQTDDHITVWVCDEGPGVEKELCSTIFDKFVQSKNDHNASGTLGIGLAICRLVVELHGGQISVEDNAPTGAKFIFTIPLLKGE